MRWRLEREEVKSAVERKWRAARLKRELPGTAALAIDI